MFGDPREYKDIWDSSQDFIIFVTVLTLSLILTDVQVILSALYMMLAPATRYFEPSACLVKFTPEMYTTLGSLI